MLKIGVLGAGHLGKIHLKCIKQIDHFDLVGFYDPDPAIIKEVESGLGIPSFENIDQLIQSSDVVDIVTPTVSHFDCAREALKAFKHVFIEKPMVATPQQALELGRLAAEAGVKVQVGHVERFNPAFLAAQPHLNNPMFIEAHRLAQFNPRGTDVPVVLDLMIHDIDIILSVVKSDIRKISASGTRVVSSTPDIANARIEFFNGCVANLTANRISINNVRKTTFFQQNGYVLVDFLDKELDVVRIQDIDPSRADGMVVHAGHDQPGKQVFHEKPLIRPVNAIESELRSFYHAVTNNTEPQVTLNDGHSALEVAYQILEKIGKSPYNLNGL